MGQKDRLKLQHDAVYVRIRLQFRLAKGDFCGGVGDGVHIKALRGTTGQQKTKAGRDQCPDSGDPLLRPHQVRICAEERVLLVVCRRCIDRKMPTLSFPFILSSRETRNVPGISIGFPWFPMCTSLPDFVINILSEAVTAPFECFNRHCKCKKIVHLFFSSKSTNQIRRTADGLQSSPDRFRGSGFKIDDDECVWGGACF